ncbi:hypothetical protein PRIPAC_73209, partial [Pristionchus pacificus]
MAFRIRLSGRLSAGCIVCEAANARPNVCSASALFQPRTCAETKGSINGIRARTLANRQRDTIRSTRAPPAQQGKKLLSSIVVVSGDSRFTLSLHLMSTACSVVNTPSS